MTRMLRLVVSVVLIAVFVCGGLLTLGTQSAHAASKALVQQDAQTTYAILQWAVQADPYVHVSNYIAYI